MTSKAHCFQFICLMPTIKYKPSHKTFLSNKSVCIGPVGMWAARVSSPSASSMFPCPRASPASCPPEWRACQGSGDLPPATTTTDNGHCTNITSTFTRETCMIPPQWRACPGSGDSPPATTTANNGQHTAIMSPSTCEMCTVPPGSWAWGAAMVHWTLRNCTFSSVG